MNQIKSLVFTALNQYLSRRKVTVVTVMALTLTAIIPLNTAIAARTNTQLTVDSLTITNPSRQVAVGTNATSTFSLSFAADSAATEAADLTVSLSVPADSQVTLTDANGSNAAADGKVVVEANKAAALTSTTIADATGTDDLVTVVAAGTILAAANTVAGTLQIKPDVPGIYVLTLTGSDLGEPSTANSISATFTIIAEIVFENTAAATVVLGELASRSKSGQLTKSGTTAPFTITGTDSLSGLTYQYQTDVNYGTSHPECNNCPAQLYESDERPEQALNPMTFTSNLSGTATVGGVSRSEIISLQSFGRIFQMPTGSSVTNQTTAGTPSFGSHFGPQFWSQPFTGADGQAVSYEWAAAGSGDDYEIYAFLVKITVAQNETCPTATDYGTTASHSILSYGRGRAATWSQATGAISENGCYRFRFVGGTYDASGGFVVGAVFYIDNVIIGQAQVINFVQPSDAITSASNQPVVLNITSNAPDPATANITLTSLTLSNCTVNSATKTVTILANRTGLCTVRADSDATGTFGPASSVTKSFTILSQATKPVSTGGDLVTGTQQVCSTLTAQEGSWTDGGSTITSTAYQWRRDGAGIAGATSSTYTATSADAGSAISYTVTKTNSVGTTSANSNSLIILDTTLSGLSLSVGTLSPSFAACTFSYAASLDTSTITITPTVSDEISSVAVSANGVVSGQASNPITLNSGSNTIEVTVTNGSQSRITTLTITYAQAPTVTVLAPTSLTGTGGTLNGSVNANGQNTSDIKFEIDTDPNFATKVTITASPSGATGSTATAVSAASGLLIAETTYYLRLLATNATGTTTSQSFSFVTPAAPAVSSSAASNLTSTGATLNGAVIGNGDASGTDTTVTFEYSLSQDMSSATIVSPDANATIAKGNTDSTSVAATLTGLIVGNTYYFRAKASNNYGTNFGSVLSFTLVGAPTVTTAAPTGADLTFTSARLTGTVNANSSNTSSILFKWGTSTNPTTQLAVVPTTAVGKTTTVVQANLTGLTKSTTYYFFLTAINAEGTTNSTEYTFTTPADPVPTATLSAPASNSLISPFTVTVTFSEVVTGFAAADLTISGATTGWTAQTAQNVANGGRIYTVEYRPGGSAAAGTITVALDANKVVDSANQSNTAATSIQVIISDLLAPNISYATNTISAGINVAITLLTPTNTGGAASAWSIDAALPGGLAISTTTGEITGTPLASLALTVFTITATNGTGFATTTVTISVVVLPAISYTPNTVTATENTAIALLSPTNTGGTIATWGISPSLPNGMSFNTATGAISGMPTTTFATANFTITATNPAGAVITVVAITVSAASSSGGGGGQPPVVVPTQPPVVVPTGPKKLEKYSQGPLAHSNNSKNAEINTVGARPASAPLVNVNLTSPTRIIEQVVNVIADRVVIEFEVGKITATPQNGWTGRISIPIIKVINNQEVEVFVDLEVLPQQPKAGTHKPTSITNSLITWDSSPSQVIKYQVELNGKVVCEVTSTSCEVNQAIGPNSEVKVTAIGNDDTRSEKVLPNYAPTKRVKAATVYFGQSSAAISVTARKQLNKIARILKREGFNDLRLIGHTDGQGGSKNSLSLSNRRANAVQTYLIQKLEDPKNIKVAKRAAGEKKPTASNQTKVGQAKNRRTEIFLR